MEIETLVSVIGETLAYVIGKATGRTFHLDPKKAQKIGEYFVLGLFAIVAITITFVFS
nr:hypothetical protein [uncultured Methylotenera sp.]